MSYLQSNFSFIGNYHISIFQAEPLKTTSTTRKSGKRAPRGGLESIRQTRTVTAITDISNQLWNEVHFYIFFIQFFFFFIYFKIFKWTSQLIFLFLGKPLSQRPSPQTSSHCYAEGQIDKASSNTKSP